jgi:hypothetical protein
VRAALLGTAAHGVLEALALETADDAAVRRLVTARPEASGLNGAPLEELIADLSAAARVLRAEAAAGLEILGREVPFVLGLPRAAPRVFLHGRIDVLARRRRLVVRDFKYALPSASAAAGYGAPLRAYVWPCAAAASPSMRSSSSCAAGRGSCAAGDRRRGRGGCPARRGDAPAARFPRRRPMRSRARRRLRTACGARLRLRPRCWGPPAA